MSHFSLSKAAQNCVLGLWNTWFGPTHCAYFSHVEFAHKFKVVCHCLWLLPKAGAATIGLFGHPPFWILSHPCLWLLPKTGGSHHWPIWPSAILNCLTSFFLELFSSWFWIHSLWWQYLTCFTLYYSHSFAIFFFVLFYYCIW